MEAPRRAVEHLQFLESRPVHHGVGNLVSAGALGWVRFWECHAEGELVAQFNAGHRPGASVSAMCTDPDSFDYLVTGDTDGYIKVWYVPRYANAAAAGDDDARLHPPNPGRFRLLQEPMILEMITVQQGRFAAPAAASDPERTWSAPALVTSFHGHLTVVTSLDYVDGRDCFVSSSDDCSLRLWTVYGAFVGIFGQDTPWLPIRPPAEDTEDTEAVGSADDDDDDAPPAVRSRRSAAKSVGRWQARRVPADVRRAASACTLRVMYGGHVPQWRVTRAKLLAYVEVFQRVMNIVARNQSRMNVPDDSTSAGSGIDMRLQLSELPSIEHSQVLGRSYRRQRRYRPLPTVPRVLQDDLKVRLSKLHTYTYVHTNLYSAKL